jgi:hypothetical protein
MHGEMHLPPRCGVMSQEVLLPAQQRLLLGCTEQSLNILV